MSDRIELLEELSSDSERRRVELLARGDRRVKSSRLPERLDAGRVSGEGGGAQVCDPRDFPRLLRLGREGVCIAFENPWLDR